MKNVIFLFSLYFFQTAFADLNYNLQLALRSDPRATNILGTVAYDHLLRGEVSKENPLYSYIRSGVKLGGSPTLAGFVQYAPVAPLVFGVERSVTARFQSNERYNCKQLECQGAIERTDYSVQGVLGYHKMFFVQSFLWRELRTDQSDKSIFIEQERFIVSPGFHNYKESVSTVGISLNEYTMSGLSYLSSSVSESQNQSTLLALFFRWKFNDLSIITGINHFKNTQLGNEGDGAFLALNLNYRESMKLF